MSECRICSNGHNNVYHTFKENMFGTNDTYEYMECANCGCIQIIDIPDDLSIFYPANYSNFRPVTVNNQNPLIQFIKRKKSEYLLGLNRNIIGNLLSKIVDKGFVYKLSFAKVSFNSKILDFGAGNGDRLLDLWKRGFVNLHGIDPFIPDNVFLSNNISVLKQDISDINDTYDLIMLNHVLEHVPNPVETLRELSKHLNKNKRILVRIPVAQGYAWREYKNKWVALDPPRHLYLHTKKSLEIVAEKAGLYIDFTLYDSTEHQFIGSEQLKKGIYQRAENSYFVNRAKSIFSKDDIKRFSKMAKELNKNNDGDAACFYLVKKNE